MTLSPSLMIIAIQAVQDSIRVTTRAIDASDDPTDDEQYLMDLSTLEAELKREYLAMRARDLSLLSYEALVGGRRFRLL